MNNLDFSNAVSAIKSAFIAFENKGVVLEIIHPKERVQGLYRQKNFCQEVRLD